MGIEFKKGDKVECIRGKGATKYYDLEEGEIYIIEKAYDIGVVKLGGSPLEYDSRRFKLVEQSKPTMTQCNFKKGDRVECISGEKSYTGRFDLEEGEIYIIEEVYNCDVRLEGYPLLYNNSRFKLVESAKPTEKESGLEAFLVNNLDKIELHMLRSARRDKLDGDGFTANETYAFYDELQRLKKGYFDELD